MKGRQAVLGHVNGLPVAAKLVDGRLDDVLVPDPNGAALGAIYRGVIDRPMKGMGGMMVRLPDGGMGFLRQSKGLAPGQPITVQLSTYAEPGKAAPVTDRIIFKSRYVIVTPHAPGINVSRQIKDDDLRDELQMLAKTEMQGSPHGLILRSSCETADIADVAEDLDAMLARADAVMAETGSAPELLIEGDDPHVLAWREWSDISDVLTGANDLEDTGVLDQIETAQSILTTLSAGSVYVEPTRALVAVDVNTSGGATPLEANLAALRDVPRLLRIKGLGGQVTIDLAPVLKKDRKLLESTLRGAMKACPVDTEFVGWTPLGHMELKRKRERAAVSEVVK